MLKFHFPFSVLYKSFLLHNNRTEQVMHYLYASPDTIASIHRMLLFHNPRNIKCDVIKQNESHVSHGLKWVLDIFVKRIQRAFTNWKTNKQKQNNNSNSNSNNNNNNNKHVIVPFRYKVMLKVHFVILTCYFSVMVQ